MAITFHSAKRDKALAERGMDFAAAEAVFAGRTYQFEDRRIDYGEVRFVTIGLLRRSYGGRRMDATRYGSPCLLDEEGQCPRASPL